MTEAEAIELLLTCISNTIAGFTIYISFTFAYLTAAFFVGSKLTLFQTIAGSGLYIASAASAIGSNFSNLTAYRLIMADTPTVLDSLYIMHAEPWIPYMLVMQGAGMLLSLYFMYDVRRRASANRNEG